VTSRRLLDGDPCKGVQEGETYNSGDPTHKGFARLGGTVEQR
jgi:hypothetical protein